MNFFPIKTPSNLLEKYLEEPFYELLTSEKEIDGAGTVRVFGIAITNGDCTVKVEDISTNASTVLALLNLLEENLCSPLHLHDVVEDYLSSLES
ncbi:MAG: DUF6514 family protein [Eubacteriales bacterium]|nr:DUF6514 family protein [Eubacteriales bacterium]MDD4474605.1 DUF6514 family protein [Eubacteriales bacterium]